MCQSGGVLVVGTLAGMGLYLSGDPEADAFITADPLALLVGMVLDQQIPLERAFAAPLELWRRLHPSETDGDRQDSETRNGAGRFVLI